MISNILPVAVLAGAAMAACPLSVEIAGATNHIAHVAVTNTGAEAITVFKGNTVLNPHPTLDLVIEDADGKALPFAGHFVNYKRTGLAADAFQTLQPGETVTTSVNAAKTYKLQGIAKAQATALQGFHYVTGTAAPAALKDMLFCEVSSAPMTIEPDQDQVAAVHLATNGEDAINSRINKRAVTYSSCSSSQTSTLQTCFTDAISMSKAASTAASSSADYYTTWFKSTSVLTKVKTIYGDVAGVQTTSPKVSCTDTYGDCSDGSALLYTVPSAKTIVPCPNNGFWGFPVLATSCTDFDYDKAGSILHESTHLYGTDDYAYGPTAAKKLSAAQAAANADTYEMYAGSVRLGGCS